MQLKRVRHSSTQCLRLVALGFAFLSAACAEKTETNKAQSDASPAVLRDIRPSAGFDATGADCAGRLYRDTATTVSGASECKNGASVSFSGHTDMSLDAGLSCDYALFYTDRAQGTGRIACTDGSTGTFAFEELDTTHGLAAVRMKDGRRFMLTYTQSVH
jgi:hypothetical protein